MTAVDRVAKTGPDEARLRQVLGVLGLSSSRSAPRSCSRYRLRAVAGTRR
jgi:hypothetical protein